MAANTVPVSALEIHQAGTTFYLARFSARDVVRLVSFVQRGAAGQGRTRSRDLADHVWNALQQVPFEERSYQRELRARKIQDIIGYYEKIEEELPLIPTPILLAAKEPLQVQPGRPLVTLQVPQVAGAFGIIDGQHRMLALKLYIERHPDTTFDVPVVIFSGESVPHMVELFAVINSTQTRVPRSHIYDLTLERPKHLQEPGLADAYRVVRFLNEDDSSALRGKIRMTGVGRGGWVAQAPLVDELMGLFEDKRTRWHTWLNTAEKKGLYFRNYFLAVQRALPGPWRYDKKFALKTGHALRAFLRASRDVLDRVREAGGDRVPTADALAELVAAWAALEPTLRKEEFYKTYFGAGPRRAVDMIHRRLVAEMDRT
jgi:DGQHR domain-containing protein